MSRAAVFAAGAAWASGCASEPSVQQSTRPYAVHARIVAGTAEPGAIEIRFVDEDGKPRPSWGVALVTSEGLRITATTDQDGLALFHRLAPGHYRVEVSTKRRDAPSANDDGRWGHGVAVTSKQVTSLVITLPPAPHVEYSHSAKPYGAPPARRRVV